ncbi:MAG: helix-turn-helix domain-containing protein [Limisphaerales bacterium]
MSARLPNFDSLPVAMQNSHMSNLLPKQTPARADENFLDEKTLLTRIPICRRTAQNWIKAGKLPCVKIGRRKLFHWPSVESALLRQQRGGE